LARRPDNFSTDDGTLAANGNAITQLCPATKACHLDRPIARRSDRSFMRLKRQPFDCARHRVDQGICHSDTSVRSCIITSDP
jgi:hypothetical protein